MRLFIITLCLSIVGTLHAQIPNHNITSIGNLPYNIILNDIWGYVDSFGTEYALVGDQGGLSIVSLAAPANPVEHTYINANFSVWRDIKTYGSYAYAVTEGGGGFLVVNLSDLPNSVTHHFVNNQFSSNSAHNLWIDEQGFLFTAGSAFGGTPVCFDLTIDPDTPTYVNSVSPAFYSHDIYVKGDTLWSANINDGFFTVYDVSDKLNPQLLATQTTSRDFCHNLWTSDDGQTLFTTDEKSGAWIDAYDVSDLSDIKRVDRWRTPNPGVVPHNVHVHNDYLVISYYDDGLVILDGSRPGNLVEVARYDTYPLSPNSSFDGAWGAYPFLPSGNILISDRQTGLHVLSPNYIRACWLEGIVTDSTTGAALYNVDINISNNIPPTNSDIIGAYKTGTAVAGTYQVTFSKLGYISKTITTTLQNGQLTIENIELALAPILLLDIKVEDRQSGDPIANSIIEIRGKTIDTIYTGMTDANGNFQQALLSTDYELWTGHWGHQTQKDSFTITTNTSTTVQLNKGYKDEFALDLGWTISGSVTRGDWLRQELYDIPGLFFSFLDADANDLGDKCMTTGIYPVDSLPVGIVWMDSGATILTSPLMDLSTTTDPYLNFQYYLYSLAPAPSALQLFVSNGNDTVQAMGFSNSSGAANWFTSSNIYLKNYVSLTNTMQVWFRAYNYNPSASSLIRVWVDDFSVVDSAGAHIAIQQIDAPKTIATVSPNPFQETISVDYAQVLLPASLEVVNTVGQIVEQRTLEHSKGNLRLGQNWDAGIYFIRIGDQILKVIKN